MIHTAEVPSSRPGAVILAGSFEVHEGAVTAGIDLGQVEEKDSLDVIGHYAWPDIFRLAVDAESRLP